MKLTSLPISYIKTINKIADPSTLIDLDKMDITIVRKTVLIEQQITENEIEIENNNNDNKNHK